MRMTLAALMFCTVTAAHAAEMKMDHPTPAAGATASDKAYAAAMKTMMAHMTMQPTGDPDRDFVSMMLPHHEGAVAMAEVELRYGKDPLLLKMARDIVDSQTKELTEMKAWQAKNGK